ncbi:hypothetical protein LTR72_011301 [Exophiala xenobiotica]|nr:hypothetical protein LTR72_011301 [Exophiala xenobiotica]KAK5285040.1 hypothetical protein LTR14_011280 [Exophiala xenobiotica]KAK5469170.1 hypothetical protein LTR55_011293 [Exophiala xenobiotica]
MVLVDEQWGDKGNVKVAEGKYIIVCTNVMSRTHFGMVKFVFEVMCTKVLANIVVSKHLCLNQKVYTTGSEQEERIHIHLNSDWYEVLTVQLAHADSNLTVMMNKFETLSGTEKLLTIADINISITASLSEPKMMYAFSQAARDRKVVMEMGMLSDPKLSILVVRTTLWDEHSTTYRTLFRSPLEATDRILSSVGSD